MRHRIQGRTLGRERAHRRALLKNLATSLILHESVVTTEGKAKEVRRYLEPLITSAKPPTGQDAKAATVAVSRRLALAVAEPGAVRKLTEDLGPKYKDRPGGYVRLTKLAERSGDGARTVKVELV